MTRLANIAVVLLALPLIMLPACSSQIKITQVSGEPKPKLVALQTPIDASIGIIPREEAEAGKTKRPYVNNAEEICQALANKLRALKAFDKVYYPVDPDARPDTTVVVEAQYYVDPHLGEAKATGFLVGLTFYLAAPAAHIRVTGDQKSRMTMTGREENQPREMLVSYEVKFNPFANVNTSQAGKAMGQNIVLHAADALALEVIQAHKPDYRARSDTNDSGP